MCVRMAVRMNDRENDAGIGLERERERIQADSIANRA